MINVTSDNEGEFFGVIWSDHANRDGHYNVSVDAVDDVSAQPGVTATVTSTQILVNNLEFGDVAYNESAYYYLKKQHR